jgi:hypothetical protein
MTCSDVKISACANDRFKQRRHALLSVNSSKIIHTIASISGSPEPFAKIDKACCSNSSPSDDQNKAFSFVPITKLTHEVLTIH